MRDSRDLPLVEQKPRVTVYAIINQLNEYSQVGVGELQILCDDEECNCMYYLEVRREQHGEVLMCSRLELKHNYEKQKGSIICWTDEDQQNYEDLAISFVREDICDFYWRIICEKIGKNYLHINSKETLRMPTQQNLHETLLQVKNNPDIINYHITNSNIFLKQLEHVFSDFQTAQNKMGMGMILRILKSIITSIDMKVIHVLLSPDIFPFLLKVYQFQNNVNYFHCYEHNFKMKNIIFINPDISNKIMVLHHANFYRQFMLIEPEQSLQSTLIMIINQIYAEILSYFSKTDKIQELIAVRANQHHEQANMHQYIENQEIQMPLKINSMSLLSDIQFINQQKVKFLIELFIIYHKNHNQKVKIRFLDKIYSSNCINFLEQQIKNQLPHAIQVVEYIAQANTCRFLNYLRDVFRQKPDANLHRLLSIKYCQGCHETQNSILNLIQSFSVQLSDKKEYCEFFNGTFVCHVLERCISPWGILRLCYLMLSMNRHTLLIWRHIIRAKVLKKIVIGVDGHHKEYELVIVKILKNYLTEKNIANQTCSQSSAILQKVTVDILQSGFMGACMQLLVRNMNKNNMISSAMLQCIELLGVMQYCEITQYLQHRYENYPDNIKNHLNNLMFKKPIQAIQLKCQDHLKLTHNLMLQSQQLERYLLNDDDLQENQLHKNGKRNNSDLQVKGNDLALEQLRKIRNQIGDVKNNSETNVTYPKQIIQNSNDFSIQFKFDFDQQVIGSK